MFNVASAATRWGLRAGLLVLMAAAAPARAEVLDADATAFTVRAVMPINAAPDTVFDALRAVAQWWDGAHTFSGHASSLTLDPKPGGCFCEQLSGGGIQHMVVIYADRGKLLRLSGGLGPLQALAVTAIWTLRLQDTDGRTIVESTYAVAGRGKDSLATLAPVVDQVMGEQIGRLKRYVER